MSFTEDQHPVGDLGPGGEHEPLRVGVRARTSGRDLHHLDTSAGEDRVERGGELAGPVAHQDLEVGGPITKVYQEITDLLYRPRPVRVRGDVERTGEQSVRVTLPWLRPHRGVPGPDGASAMSERHRWCGVTRSGQACYGMMMLDLGELAGLIERR